MQPCYCWPFPNPRLMMNGEEEWGMRFSASGSHEIYFAFSASVWLHYRKDKLLQVISIFKDLKGEIKYLQNVWKGWRWQEGGQSESPTGLSVLKSHHHSWNQDIKKWLHSSIHSSTSTCLMASQWHKRCLSSHLMNVSPIGQIWIASKPRLQV
jgi:hypothetical protein